MKNFYSVIPTVNIALVVSGLMLGGYLLYSMSKPYQVGSLGSIELAEQPFESVVRKTLDSLPAFSKGIFKNSELFRSGGKKTAAKDTRSLVLLGVSMGKKKLAVIRDTKANKDYYCTENDIAGEYTIKEIFKDKVVLEYDGSTVEITR
jgi:type II secretory pathway component PulC